MIDLGTLGGSNSAATGLNAFRTVVGTADTDTKANKNQNQAFMSTLGNRVFKLEPQITKLPTPMKLKIRPSRVSNVGAVIGPGTSDPEGTAFPLTPTP